MSKGNRKLTDEQVDEIRCLNRKRIHYRGLADVYSVANIATRYNVAPTTVINIIDGVSYQDVPDKWCEDNDK